MSSLISNRRTLPLLIVLFIALTARGDGPETSDVLPLLRPSTTQPDPGPTSLIGSETNPTGRQFSRANIYVDGTGDCRIYFDYRDKQNFHYADRIGNTLRLGLCEAGVEQVFATGTLPDQRSFRLARHGSHIGAFQGGVLVAAAFDDRLLSGAVGYRMLGGDPAVTIRAEPCDDIHFSDDFMISENKAAQWHGNGNKERGDFSVKSLRHPALSANAFNYMGAGKEIHSVVGQPWWDYYSYQAALRGPAGQSIGLVFAYQNEKNYGLFRWTARKGAADGEMGKRELVVFREGAAQVLAQAPGGYIPDQWYQAEIRLTYSRAVLQIDGHVLFDVSDPSLACGGAGVWCDVALPATIAADPKAQAYQVNSLNELMRQHAVFDDVAINSIDGVEDNFSTPGNLSGGWLVGRGRWDVQKRDPLPAAPLSRGREQAGCELRVLPGVGPSKALLGDRRWGQYQVEAEVRPGNGSAGLVFLHRDESNYYTAIIDHQTLKLTRVSDGVAATVDSAPLPKSAGGATLRATIKHGHVLVQAEPIDAKVGSPAASAGGTGEAPVPHPTASASVETFEGESVLRGRAGLIASGEGVDESRASFFRRFQLSFLSEPEPLVTSHAVFEGELTMSDWANPTREWYTPPEQLLVNGRPVNLLQHNSQFPGDVELMVEPREFTDTKYDLALSVSREGQKRKTGYTFRFISGETAEGVSRPAKVQILRYGETVLQKDLEDVRQLASLSLRRCGKYVIGSVNGRPAAHYRDENPLTGTSVAFYTQGVTVRTEAIKIVSEHFRNESFQRAPTDWRTAGFAIAEVTNRWQCDPRWSFFSLKNDRKAGKPAVLWSKHLYPGDVTIEFYVSNKMEGERGQPYTYARDICISICSDGNDLTKGYTFMFGSEGPKPDKKQNQKSVILRNGVEVKSAPRGIPMDMNLHRHWFNFKVEKRGNRVSFRVDRYFVDDNTRTQELVYEDEQPLTGDHLALWTYNHAIMISRVRISGDGGNTTDHPDWQPGALKTPYDE